MKQEALDRTLWRARSGRCYGSVVRLLNNSMSVTKEVVDLY